jgi:NAD(P)-dependent dehydrogenase (short-subunit alcohol dehydrogenase family)
LSRGVVVITGTSSGIGRACALRMDRAGFEVFAGVRSDSDADDLRSEASERLRPLTIDVADSDSIVAAAATVAGAVGDRGLAGLVNNAGITVQGPLEFVPIEDLRRQYEVNVVGQVATIQALLPLLRRARGRIVNMSSIGGRVANAFLGPYQSSKFAIEALTDALRKELRPWGIHVVAIEPGSIDTRMWSKGIDSGRETVESLPPDGRELYGDQLQAVLAMAQKVAERAIPPDRVAKVVERALTARRPRTRYLVGPDARVQLAIGKLLPDRAADAVEARLMGL